MKRAILILCLISGASIVYSQSAPTANNVQVLGTGYYNGTQTTKLYASYTYDDVNNDLENGTTFEWFKDGSTTGITTSYYTVTSADNGSNITVKVTPINAVAPTTGATVTSSNSVTVSSTSYADYSGGGFTVPTGTTRNDLNAVFGNNETVTINGTGIYHIWGDLDVNQKLNINVNNTAQLIIHGNLQIGNNLTLYVAPDASFSVLAGLTAKNSSVFNVSGDATVIGNLTVENTATFSITDGGSLAISGSLTAGTGTDINVVSGSMSISGNASIAGGSIDISGGSTFSVGGDLTGTATIDGTGTITVGGTVGSGITDPGTGQLPVELIAFTANYIQNKVDITWTTASELNNNFFVIEYSVDAQNWDVLAQVAGSGNSTNVLNYEYQHFTKNSYYYRLKQVDFDGKTETFKPVFVNTPYINEDANYQVYDIMGKYIMTGTYQEFVSKITLHGQYILKSHSDCRKIIR
jgi:hypothetical protein